MAGGPEPLFWVLLMTGIVLALLGTASVAVYLGVVPGAVALGLFALVILLIVLGS